MRLLIFCIFLLIHVNSFTQLLANQDQIAYFNFVKSKKNNKENHTFYLCRKNVDYRNEETKAIEYFIYYYRSDNSGFTGETFEIIHSFTNKKRFRVNFNKNLKPGFYTIGVYIVIDNIPDTKFYPLIIR